VPLRDVERDPARVLAGTAAPPDEVVTDAVVAPHGWLILQPA
jgi:hypothetical protein